MNLCSSVPEEREDRKEISVRFGSSFSSFAPEQQSLQKLCLDSSGDKTEISLLPKPNLTVNPSLLLDFVSWKESSEISD